MNVFQICKVLFAAGRGRASLVYNNRLILYNYKLTVDENDKKKGEHLGN